jgi:transcriptional regulator with XRE-family HTH domain
MGVKDFDNIAVGDRIKQFRSIYNLGSKISSVQLAHRLEVEPALLRNYESGRSSLPLGLLLKIHNIGLGMHFVLTGEGLMFSDTEEGHRLKAEMDSRGVDYPGKSATAAAGEIVD